MQHKCPKCGRIFNHSSTDPEVLCDKCWYAYKDYENEQED